MTHYQQLISEATGVTDLVLIEQIEDVMRHEIFHSTLDWQSRDQLIKGAIEAKQVIDAL